MKFLKMSLLSLIFITHMQFSFTVAARTFFQRMAPQLKVAKRVVAGGAVVVVAGVSVAVSAKNSWELYKSERLQNMHSLRGDISLLPPLTRSVFDVAQDIRNAHLEGQFWNLEGLYQEMCLRKKHDEQEHIDAGQDADLFNIRLLKIIKLRRLIAHVSLTKDEFLSSEKFFNSHEAAAITLINATQTAKKQAEYDKKQTWSGWFWGKFGY